MNTGGEAAEQIVRMSLEGFEVAAKITGAGAKNIAILLYSILKEEKKTKGKARLTSMLRSGKELKVFTVKNGDLKKFTQEAKKYGVLYCVLTDRKNKDPNAEVDVIARAEDASKISRIVERFNLASVDTASTLIRSVSKTILHSPFALDILESEHISLIEKIDSNSFPLFKIAECENACATSDCYKLKKYIYSLQSPTDYREETQLKTINTGTIGRYLSRWDTAEMKYLKDKYSCPVVNKNQFLAAFPNSYGSKSLKPKIIIKGLNLLDACIDLYGNVIPGKTTMIISATDDKLYLLLGIINSKLTLFYIKQRYSSSSYNGGITFTKEMINSFPIKNNKKTEYQQISNLVREIVTTKSLSTETYNELEKKINTIIYNIFDLTDDEIDIIEESVK